MQPRRIWVLAPLAALALGATAAQADPAETARQHAADARQHAADARQQAAEARAHAAAAAASGNAAEAQKAAGAAKEARDEAKGARDEAREARKDARGDGGLPDDQQRQERRQRRHEHRAELRQKWGDPLLRHPAVRAELRTHAWRLARLHRVRQLADAAGKKAVVERVDALLAKEQARYEKHMATLKSKGGEE